MEIKQKGTIKVSWWLVLVAVLAFGSIGYLVYQNIKIKNSGPIAARQDSPNDIKVKQYLSSLRGDVVKFYETNKTYQGWVAPSSSMEQVEKIGSQIKTGQLSDSSYVIYAVEPDSKLIFCLDSAGFTGELKKIKKNPKSCN